MEPVAEVISPLSSMSKYKSKIPSHDGTNLISRAFFQIVCEKMKAPCRTL